MRIIKVIASENIKWWHKLAVYGIEKVEGVNFNHVSYLLEDGFFYEAVWPKSRRVKYLEWKKDFKVIKTYEIHLNDLEYELMENKIKKQVGVSYSVWQCIMIYVAQSISLLKEKIESTNWNGWKALICSEFVARPIVEVLGYKFDQGIDSIGMDEVEIMLKSISTRSY